MAVQESDVTIPGRAPSPGPASTAGTGTQDPGPGRMLGHPLSDQREFAPGLGATGARRAPELAPGGPQALR